MNCEKCSWTGERSVYLWCKAKKKWVWRRQPKCFARREYEKLLDVLLRPRRMTA